MPKKKKVAIFDIDGTIFRSSLLIELTEAMTDAGIFPASARASYIRAYRGWINRQQHYDVYIRGVIDAFENNLKGVSRAKYLHIARRTADFHRNRVYRYTRDLVRDLKKKNYYLLAISNSPKEIVEAFAKDLGFSKVYGRMYEVDPKGKFTGVTLFENLVRDKAKMLQYAMEKEHLTLQGSIGVGDTESDIRFLRMVDRPICFNPNERLYRYARRAGWSIVVERKDVIYEL